MHIIYACSCIKCFFFNNCKLKEDQLSTSGKRTFKVMWHFLKFYLNLLKKALKLFFFNYSLNHQRSRLIGEGNMKNSLPPSEQLKALIRRLRRGANFLLRLLLPTILVLGVLLAERLWGEKILIEFVYIFRCYWT